MGPGRQAKGLKRSPIRVWRFEQIDVATEVMDVIAHRSLFAVEGRWMGNRDVVIVECVVVGDLPIATGCVVSARRLPWLGPSGCGRGLDQSQLLLKRDRFFGEGDPDERTLDLTRQFAQPPGLAIKTGLKPRLPGCRLQLAIQVVSPPVIRADQSSA